MVLTGHKQFWHQKDLPETKKMEARVEASEINNNTIDNIRFCLT